MNCNAELHGRYCHVCGQENVEPKESFWQLVTHFVYDITHFDGKFFETVKYLLLKPGFLSLEYMRGRRASYLNPIKMYVFTSAFFFLFFFSFVVKEPTIKMKEKNRTYTYAQALEDIEDDRKTYEKALQKPNLPGTVKITLDSQIAFLDKDIERLKKDTTNLAQLNVYKSTTIDLDEKFSSVAEYDSIQNSLPKDKRDGWIEKQYRRKKIEVTAKYKNDMKAIMNAWLDKFFHLFPQILFISLPVFALLLKLLYIRRRKQYYYGDHGIYAVHLYCAMFILIFIEIILSRIEDLPYLKWVSYVALFFLGYILWYIYKSMRVFYQQSRAKTIIKYLLVMCLSFFVMMFLSVIFFIFSAYSI